MALEFLKGVLLNEGILTNRLVVILICCFQETGMVVRNLDNVVCGLSVGISLEYLCSPPQSII